MIKATNIHKEYNKKTILSKVNIQINPSEIVSLIGPSGCGKTTLLKILSLLENPDKGIVEIDSRVFNFPTNQPLNLVGIYPNLTIVFQQFQLWKHLTVNENILLPIRNVVIERKNLYDELIELFGISQILSNYPHQISVGQKQRVAFIRAVLTKPKYLLLDEVTSSLDIEYTNKMMQFIKKMANNGTGILLTTHLIGFAKTISNTVYFMDKGSVIESGQISILNNPKTDRLKQFLSLVDS